MMITTDEGWRFSIDRGGTFTDVIARAPDGRIAIRKLLSEAPERYADAAVAAITAILAENAGEAPVLEIRMGTTVATNALLERKGEPTVLVITQGFRDQLRIGYQNRPEIFALAIHLPDMLYTAAVEASERVDAQGRVLEPLDEPALQTALAALRGRGISAVAICFLHAWRFPDHERRAGAIARRVGFTQVSMSHEVSPLMRLVSRGDTTVADAYLSPVLHRYVERLRSGLGCAGVYPRRLLFMQSNGGLAGAGHFRGRDSVLSGPAGGVVGVAAAARACGWRQLIGFDMGGTSTDVSLCVGEPELVTDTEIGGVRIRSPVVRIHTIAAGGGSLLRFEQGRLQVGPQSAGANPGPACYRRGGPLALTDANLLLGRILPEFFPAVFGPHGDAPLDATAVAGAFSRLAAVINGETGTSMPPEAVAAGFLQIAVDNMANAIRRISLARGFDPRQFTLCCFGGAGGQHACAVADRLGITRILVHPFAGVFSAWGIGGAPLRVYRQHSAERLLGATSLGELQQEVTALGTACREELLGQGAAPGVIELRTTLYLRASGSDTALPLAPAPVATLRAAFCAAHRRRFGFEPVTAELIIASVRVEATAGQAASPEPVAGDRSPSPPVPERCSRLYSGGAWLDARVYRRAALHPGQSLTGPAIITEDNATTVVDAGWIAEVDPRDNLILRRTEPQAPGDAPGTAADPVLLEVFNNQFMAIAEEMGTILQNTAHSVNIKERLDFSCALFDGEGNLIANAPHMPVHLGSMGASVRAVISANAGRPRPGDAFMLNSPFRGGTHLPDVTVVTPVAGATDGAPAFFVACRAHHADIGGVTPGSMPPDSRTIEEEGVVIENFRLVEAGLFHTETVRQLLSRGSYPARNPEQNIADLRAQVAANAAGVHALGRLLERYGEAVVRAYMGHVRGNAEECVRRVIERLRDGGWSCTLDSGETIQVRVAVDRGRREATVDLTGTSPRSGGNFNAPAAITRAVVLYVFRTLVGSDIPLNDGCLTPLRIVLPPDSLLDPSPPAAVAAGNVETSQCLTDALYGALGAMAACQGTMNNLTFGNGQFQYYETICGGAGAGPDFDGASCVHTHMTNSRMTDPEVLEARYPVLVREFAVRPGSGGAGRHRGGDGARRVLEFRAPMQVAILSGRRIVPPFGLAGGGPGKPGRSYRLQPGGEMEELGPTARLNVSRGDVLVIETPGGGGYGRPA